MRVKLATLFMMLASGPVLGAPKVATDIPPVHSLVAAVMGDIGTPALVVRPGASPHGYAMAPSEARTLSQADVVFWISPTLTPWLDRAIETLAPNALAITLMEADAVVTLPFREGALFEKHDHEEHGDHEEHRDHDEHSAESATHEEEEHADHEEHEEHADDHDEHDNHGGDEHHDEEHHDEAQDPHIWLDPQNARAMTRAIIAALSSADPENATAYAANGEELIGELHGLEAEITEMLAQTKQRPFVVFHDAYHYFEARFEVEASGAIAVSDATQPGPARLAEVQNALRDLGAPCVFTEPQFPEARARLVMEGTSAKLATLDPMGAALTPGAGLYGAMMRQMAEAIRGCLAE